MDCNLVEWVNLLLTTEVFQSYSCIVTPNEVQETRPRPTVITGVEPKKDRNQEGLNYYKLKKRYMKTFLKTYNSSSSRSTN